MIVTDENPTKIEKIFVFYDGGCGLCSREINHYKKIAALGVFEWVDITDNAESFEYLGFTKENGLRALHARDIDGEIHVGVDAFILVWGQLQRWHLLAKLIKLPLIKRIADLSYKYFANWRFKKLGYGACKTNKK